MQTVQLPSVALWFREGSSDKVYRVAVDAKDDGFVVNFAYGRRGATLNTGTKTQQPVTHDEALKVYENLVRSKTTKGYKPVNGDDAGTGVGMTVTDREQRDTGLRPQLLNAVDDDESEAYLDSDDWCAQEKFDGKRMLIRKMGDGIVAANRNGLSIGFPTAVAELLSGIAGDFVIDGESVGETLYVFDLLEDSAGDLRSTPYRQRLKSLDRCFGRLTGPITVAETATGREKRPFLDWLKAAGKEGVVFKDLGAPWNAGRPASGGTALKHKFWASCSCVVAKVNAKRSVELALSGHSVGNVTIPANHDVPGVGQVVEIRYLYVTGPGGSLYQPVYQGVRDDVSAEECTEERQRLKHKAAA